VEGTPGADASGSQRQLGSTAKQAKAKDNERRLPFTSLSSSSWRRFRNENGNGKAPRSHAQEFHGAGLPSAQCPQ
jgi:hypothetical protein